MTWRDVVDATKRSPFLLRLADRMGRGTGRFRVLDRLGRLPAAPLKPDLSGWESEDLAAVWIGHATVLLRIGGMTVLTDPVFSSRVGIGLGLMTLGPRRLVAPALSIAELPPVDLILISHAHFDHLDRPTLRQLNKRSAVVTAAGTADLLTDLGFASVTELPWGEQTTIGRLKITAREVSHWGARTFHDRYRRYNAYLLESRDRRVLYAGDTADHRGFSDLNGIDLAVFGIGAYDPYIAAHATPEQVAVMATDAKAAAVLPMHHATFKLSHEPLTEPIARMTAAAGPAVVVTEIGGRWRKSGI